MEEVEKSVHQSFNVNSSFGELAKRVEDAMDIEEAGCTNIPEQISSKAFNLVVNSQALLYTGVKEWRRKSSADKTYSNFKLNFAKEVSDFHKDQGLTSRNPCPVKNSTNQALLQAQEYFRDLTQTLMSNFKQ